MGKHRASGTLRNIALAIYSAEFAFLERREALGRNDEFDDADEFVAQSHDCEFDDADAIIDAGAEFEDADALISGLPDDGRLTWLLREVRRLDRLVVRILDKKQFRLPLREVIAAGFRDMDEAEKMPYGPKAAKWFRDGLLVAMLGHKPVRIGTAEKTNIPEAQDSNGSHMVVGTDGFTRLIWPATANKNRRELVFKIPKDLAPRVQRWLGHFRGAMGGARGSNAFFVGSRFGRGLTKAGIRQAFQAPMLRHFQMHVPPHLIRSIVATFIAEEAPLAALAGAITDELGHVDPRSDKPYLEMVRGDAAQDRLAEAFTTLIISGPSNPAPGAHPHAG
jgi:integrase